MLLPACLRFRGPQFRDSKPPRHPLSSIFLIRTGLWQPDHLRPSKEPRKHADASDPDVTLLSLFPPAFLSRVRKPTAFVLSPLRPFGYKFSSHYAPRKLSTK